MKGALKYLLAALLAVLLLLFVFRDTQWNEVWAAMKTASIPGLALAVVLNLAQNIPRVWRWGALLRPVRPGIPFRPMFGAVLIGYMTTFVVPGRLGELVRPALLAGRENVPLGPSMGSIVADRLLDGVSIVTLFSLAVFIQPAQGGVAESVGLIRAGAMGMLAVIGTGLSVLLLFSYFRAPLEVWFSRQAKPVRWLGRTVLAFARGVEALRKPRLLAVVLLHSFLAWLLISLATWVGLRACGAALPFGTVLVLMPLLALGVAVPTPGNIGGYQGVMTEALKWFGVDPSVAVSAGILMHLVVTLPLILAGLVMLKVERVSWKHLLSAAKQIRNLGSSPSEGMTDDPAAEGTS